MESIAIIDTGYHIILSCPYHPDIPVKSKLLNGSYDIEEKTWEFELRYESQVRQMCIDIFGTDGTFEPAMVDIHVQLDLLCRGKDADVWACGRMLAKRFQKDRSPSLGKGVTLLSGGFAKTAGSTKKPQLKPLPNTMVEVVEVPLELAQKETYLSSAVMIATEQDLVKQSLLDEAERLRARLQEIEELLKEL